jgi:hypothetical protein
MLQHAAQLALEGADFLFRQRDAGEFGDVANVKIRITHRRESTSSDRAAKGKSTVFLIRFDGW